MIPFLSSPKEILLEAAKSILKNRQSSVAVKHKEQSVCWIVKKRIQFDYLKVIVGFLRWAAYTKTHSKAHTFKYMHSDFLAKNPSI